MKKRKNIEIREVAIIGILTVSFLIPSPVMVGIFADADESWVPYIPSRTAVTIEHFSESQHTYMDVCIQFGVPCYNVTLGVINRTGNTFCVDTQILRWTGFCIQVYPSPMCHTYSLGVLEDGSYTFVFKVWGSEIKTVHFDVGPIDVYTDKELYVVGETAVCSIQNNMGMDCGGPCVSLEKKSDGSWETLSEGWLCTYCLVPPGGTCEFPWILDDGVGEFRFNGTLCGCQDYAYFNVTECCHVYTDKESYMPEETVISGIENIMPESAECGGGPCMSLEKKVNEHWEQIRGPFCTFCIICPGDTCEFPWTIDDNVSPGEYRVNGSFGFMDTRCQGYSYFNVTESPGYAKIQGIVSSYPEFGGWVGAAGANIVIDTIICDSVNHLEIGDTVTVTWPLVYPPVFDSVDIGERVEICGEYKDIKMAPKSWTNLGEYWIQRTPCNITPIFAVEITCSEIDKDIPPMGTVFYDIIVTNTGNIIDIINLSLPDPCRCGWLYSLSNYSVQLLPNEIMVVILNVTTLWQDASLWPDPWFTTVTATSVGNPTAFDTLTVSTTIVNVTPMDNSPPRFINVTCSPPIIPEDTDGTPHLCSGNPVCSEVTVIATNINDTSNISSVTINLSSLGWSPSVPLARIPGTNIWYILVNATEGAALHDGTGYIPHSLVINASDEYGNWNTTIVNVTVWKNGDVSGDGIITLYDATYLAKWYFNQPGFEYLPPNVADVSGDCQITLYDATYLAKWYFNQPGFEELH